MADTTFTDGVTKIVAAWLNEINDFYHTLFDGATTAPTARAALDAAATNGDSSEDFSVQNLNIAGEVTTPVDIGDPGTESAGININGTPYTHGIRINDIGGSTPAEVVYHRHSTTLQPLSLSARSNSDTSTHGTVSAGQVLFTHYSAGWTGSHYDLFGGWNFLVGTGTVSATSSPGKWTLQVTPDGSNTPATAITVDSDKSVVFAGDVATQGLSVTGDVVVSGTVDGRDVAADGTKLDGIEAGATADQTASEVAFTPAGNIAATDVQAAIQELDFEKAALGGNTFQSFACLNLNPTGTVDGRDVAADGTKLDGIEAGADVTDATNVAAAGAVMETGTQTVTGDKDFTGALTKDSEAVLTEGSAVTNFTLGGTIRLYNGTTTPSYDLVANLIESTWESIGPTGSGADNIWTDLDAIPSTAKALILSFWGQATGTATGIVEAYVRRDGAAGTSFQVLADTDVDASNGISKDANQAIVPIDSVIFEAFWNNTGTTSETITARLVGFIE